MSDLREAFPPPPRYASLFANDDGSVQIRPPSPPQQGEYQQFGEIHHIETGLPRLPIKTTIDIQNDNIDVKSELKRLNHMTFIAISELMSYVADGHSDISESLDEILNIIGKMHQIINQLRPFQAADSLRESLIAGINDRKDAIQLLKFKEEKAKLLLKKYTTLLSQKGKQLKRASQNI